MDCKLICFVVASLLAIHYAFCDSIYGETESDAGIKRLLDHMRDAGIKVYKSTGPDGRQVFIRMERTSTDKKSKDDESWFKGIENTEELRRSTNDNSEEAKNNQRRLNKFTDASLDDLLSGQPLLKQTRASGRSSRISNSN